MIIRAFKLPRPASGRLLNLIHQGINFITPLIFAVSSAESHAVFLSYPDTQLDQPGPDSPRRIQLLSGFFKP
jgi:hypothetical protein